MQDILLSHDNGCQTDIIVLDFSKAFDTMPQKSLLLKMDHYCVRGPLLTWLQNFLIQRRMRVVEAGEASEEAAVFLGVPQGIVLGPLLFLCHINDLPQSLKPTV